MWGSKWQLIKPALVGDFLYKYSHLIELSDHINGYKSFVLSQCGICVHLFCHAHINTHSQYF
jgi:hypothetical protein